ncbi:hypothetical protein [Laceyella tengchongensis]|uniref:hypothetical protein n=1 Tax=Laceyella tengchongensis TaxID=574699 RepID=UPI0012B97F1C|nr:hypothetical protein [Laceyella tengchongensis]
MISAILLLEWNNDLVYADHENTIMKQPPFEKMYFDIGYKSIEEALDECEAKYQRSLHLPFQLPPLEFTHQFGRFSDLEGGMNDDFEIEYINEHSPQNHYKISVRPLEHAISIKKERIDRIYTFQDGTKALYVNGVAIGFNLLVFEKDHWQYILSIDKRVAKRSRTSQSRCTE